MDTIGLIAAWVGVMSFLVAIVIAIGIISLRPLFLSRLVLGDKAAAEQKLEQVTRDLEIARNGPNNRELAEITSLYGGAILTVVAAVGMVVISIAILDLGPAILASILPFNINAKLLTRASGLLMLAVSYVLIFRLAYLFARLQSKTRLIGDRNLARLSRDAQKLRTYLALSESETITDSREHSH